MAINYKDKIRKLLALAESPVEAEAKAALLKARELMAEHKLTEAELDEAKKQSVKDVQTDITASKRREPWAINLSAVIGENYRCKGYRRHLHGQQMQYIGFIGLEDDIEVCVEIFKYALDCIRAGVKRVKEENAGYPTNYVKSLCNSYGYGFVRGIQAAFERQQEENRDGWGLVLVIPQEVQEAVQSFGHAEFRSRAEEEISPSDYARGYAEGKEFSPAKRLKGEETA